VSDGNEALDPEVRREKIATIVKTGALELYNQIGRATKDVDGKWLIDVDPERVLSDLTNVIDALHLQKADLEPAKEDPRAKPKDLRSLRELAKIFRETPKIPLGLEALDNVIGGGVLPGWTVIVGAFSGGGKTTLTTFEGVHFATRGHPVLMLTNELSEIEVTNRVDQTLDVIDDLPAMNVWSPEGDIDDVIRGMEKWIKAQDGNEKTPIIIADYLQKFKPPQHEKSRERQVAIIAEAFQAFGRKHGAVMIVAAQLNRLSQSDTGPQLHHLRESGLIEQVADVALLLSKVADDQAKILIGKNRWGTSGKEVTMSVDWVKSRFGTLTEAQRWGELGGKIRQFILDSGSPRVKIRDISQKLAHVIGPHKHPLREHIEACSIATRMFRIEGSEVVMG
jgi:replicative DNA helicase